MLRRVVCLLAHFILGPPFVICPCQYSSANTCLLGREGHPRRHRDVIEGHAREANKLINRRDGRHVSNKKEYDKGSVSRYLIVFSESQTSASWRGAPERIG
jgi:hypothetical protein